MDLSKYSIEDLLLSALKSEVDSKEVYLKLAESVHNFFLKDRLKFLAGEEEKHRIFIESLFKKKVPGKGIVLPEKTPVPLPEIKIADETVPISEVLLNAMEAEKAAQDFYFSLAERFKEETDVKNTLKYFANMEMGHYKILEVERNNALEFEQYDQIWPMMHAGH
jgi:rubrerythrin